MDHVADVNVETLIAAYHSIRNTWRQETLVSAQRIPSLIRGTTISYQVYAVAQQRRRKVGTPSDLIGDLFYQAPREMQFPPWSDESPISVCRCQTTSILYHESLRVHGVLRFCDGQVSEQENTIARSAACWRTSARRQQLFERIAGKPKTVTRGLCTGQVKSLCI